MTQDPMTSKKENTAPAQPSVPAAKEKESVKELLPSRPSMRRSSVECTTAS